MSGYNHSSNMESQPTTWRRGDDPRYQDDPDFNAFTSDLSDRLFRLTTIVSRLSGQVGLLGTRRETERVRERVRDLIDEGGQEFREIGEDLKKVLTWPDVGVRCPVSHLCTPCHHSHFPFRLVNQVNISLTSICA